MALLSKERRERRFQYLGFGEYNEKSIKKFQKTAFPHDEDEWDGVYGKHTDNALRTIYNVKRFGQGYFEPEEFTCKCGHCCGYPTYMKKVQIQHLVRIRKHYGKPMHVTSGMRCEYENTQQGGVSNSGHLRGYATDFYMQGVTETVKQRTKALKWIKKQPNHQFTYGAYMYDSDGNYRVAKSMGNAMHTETHAPKTTFTDKIFSACKEEAKWMKNYKYGWESYPTIPKSKKKGTCVTYVACVLQRLDYLKPGQYIWHNESGKVTHANDKMQVIYPEYKSIKSLKSKLKAGDILMAGKKGDVGSGSHIFVFTGKWSKSGDPYIYDNHSAERVRRGKSPAHTYSRNKKLIAIVRLKRG